MQALLLCQNSDETAILTLVLQRAGYGVMARKDPKQLIENWPDIPFEMLLVVFRGELPLTQIRQLRVQSAAPILLICDPQAEDQQIALWETCIDLLVFRPYSAHLLVTQVRALGRRTAGVPHFVLPPLKRAALTLDTAARTIQLNSGPPTPLTRLEFRLLYTLMSHPRQVFPAKTLIEHVWGYAGEGDRNLIRGLIKRLRGKVEPDPSQPRYILTQVNVGYYFNQEREA